MAITLRPIRLPDFEVPHARPAIPAETYAARADAAYRRAGPTKAYGAKVKRHIVLLYLTNAGSDIGDDLLQNPPPRSCKSTSFVTTVVTPAAPGIGKLVYAQLVKTDRWPFHRGKTFQSQTRATRSQVNLSVG